jgi:RNA polymerase sigma factor FliA
MQTPEGLRDLRQDSLLPSFSDTNESSTRLTPEQAELVSANLAFASQIVQQYRRTWPSLSDDIEQAAFLGLVEAASRNDNQEEAHFRTYAYMRIRGAAVDEIQRANHLKPKTQRKIREWKSTEAKLSQQLLRSVSPQEIAQELGLEDAEAQLLAHHAQYPYLYSIDAPLAEHNQASGIPDDSVPGEDEIIESLDKPIFAEIIRGVVGGLVEGQREIITKHFLEDVPISTIAAERGVSVQAVNQTKNIALGHLALMFAA